MPSTDKATIFELAGSPHDDPPVYGDAYEVFGGGEAGAAACEALWGLGSVGAINTMLSNFIKPLQENADKDSRVHCSLNLNTETGAPYPPSPLAQP
jgi:DNA polymerase-1